MKTISTESISAAVDAIAHTIAQHRMIWTCGNGGSAAIAAHFALDLSYTRTSLAPLQVRAATLAGHTAVLTAVANDNGYDAVFARQLSVLACRDDTLVAISVSGTSPNVLAAAEFAHKLGVQVVALIGARGSPLAALADHAVVFDSTNYEVVEDGAQVVCHVISDSLKSQYK